MTDPSTGNFALPSPKSRRPFPYRLAGGTCPLARRFFACPPRTCRTRPTFPRRPPRDSFAAWPTSTPRVSPSRRIEASPRYAPPRDSGARSRSSSRTTTTRVRIRFRRRSSRTRPGRRRFTSRGSRRIRTVAEEATRARGASRRRGGGARETRVTRDAPRGIDERFRTRRHGALSETRVRRRRRQPDDEGFLRSRETRREHAPKTRARKRVTIVQTVRVTNGFAGRRRFCGKTSSSRAWIDRAPDHA